MTARKMIRNTIAASVAIISPIVIFRLHLQNHDDKTTKRVMVVLKLGTSLQTATRRRAGGAGTSRGNFSQKKNYKKHNYKKVFNKKPHKQKRYAESDHYDTGDESGSEVLNRSNHHQAPYVPDIQMQYPVQMQWQPQQQQYLPPPTNKYIAGMNHQRPFINQQPG